MYGKNISLNTEYLEKVSDLLFQCFTNNYMKANEEKCHVILSNDKNMLVNIGATQIQNKLTLFFNKKS